MIIQLKDFSWKRKYVTSEKSFTFILFQKFKYEKKERKKATVTIVDETDGKDKEIDLSIHARTAKTVPVQDENPRKRAISQANLKVIVTFYITHSIMKNKATFQLLHNKFSQNKNFVYKVPFCNAANNICNYEYWITHPGFRMHGCYFYYVYFSIDCTPRKLLLHSSKLQNSIEKKHEESQQI